MALSITDLKALTLPDSILPKEIYDKTPGWRIKHRGYNLFDIVSQIITASGAGAGGSIVDNTNGTYTWIPTTGASVLIDTRATSNPVTTGGLIPAANNTVQKNIDWIYQYMSNAQALFGVTWTPSGINPTFGTFTGWTLSDNSSAKSLFQELEIAVQDAIHLADNGLTKITGTGTGLAQAKVQLGGNLIQNTDIITNGFTWEVRNSANNTFFQATDALVQMRSSEAEITVTGGTMLFKDKHYFGTTLGTTANTYTNNGRILINTDAGTGEFEVTPYWLPLTDGTAGQTFVTDGAGAVAWKTPNVTGARNGLSVVANNVELGGTLIKPTTVTTTGFVLNFGNTTTNYIQLTDTKTEMKSGDVAVELDASKFNVKDTHFYNATNGTGAANTYGATGRILINTNATTGEFQTTPYRLPLTDGTSGQELRTNGAGIVTWNTRKEYVSIQEFLTNEIFVNRNGESFWVVPLGLNGARLTSYTWSVFTPNTGTINIELERNGAVVPTSSVALAASAQTGNQGVTPLILATGDRIRVNTSGLAGAPPQGLTVTLEMEILS